MTDAPDKALAETVADAAVTTKYPNLRPWKPGQSGNPSGRPKKDRHVADTANQHADKALRKLIQLMDSEDDRVALAAVREVLDRAVGKPKQALDVSDKRDAADYSESELLAIARMGSAGADPAQEGSAEPDSFH